MNHLLLMMGGSGTRFGSDIPKQFVEVEGKPVFSYIAMRYQNLSAINTITLVCHSSWIEYSNTWMDKLKIDKLVSTVSGGTTRSTSVRNGLRALSDVAADEDVVLIHDATHPYLDERATCEAIEATKIYGAATLGQRQYDTVYRTNKLGDITEVVPRELIVSGASPELFLYKFLHHVYEETNEEDLAMFTSAGALALAHGIKMKVIPTDLVNLKITYKHDMELFEKLFHGYYF